MHEVFNDRTFELKERFLLETQFHKIIICLKDARRVEGQGADESLENYCHYPFLQFLFLVASSGVYLPFKWAKYLILGRILSKIPWNYRSNNVKNVPALGLIERVTRHCKRKPNTSYFKDTEWVFRMSHFFIQTEKIK